MRPLIAFLALVVVQPAASAAVPPAAELARALQQRYDGIRDFSAEFVHAYEGGALGRTTTERGTLLVKKPGRMRWTYQAPEAKVFVADGSRLYSYIPADRQVIVSPLPEEDEATLPILFLVGKGHLARDFTASHAEVPDQPGHTYALKLVPHTPQAEYDSLTLVVDRDTLQLRMLRAEDGQGGTSTFTFRNLRENIGLQDRAFSFSIPRGVDVVTTGGPRQ